MRTLLNILWFVLGGFVMGLLWWLAGVIMYITIIGAPWGAACFRIGLLAFWPFGKTTREREYVTGHEDLGTGPMGFLANVLWFVLAGVWLAIGHLAEAVALAVTIIGIPFAIQHLKLAKLCLSPVGVTVVDYAEVE